MLYFIYNIIYYRKSLMLLWVTIAVSIVPCFQSLLNNYRVNKSKMYKNFCIPEWFIVSKSNLYYVGISYLIHNQALTINIGFNLVH